MKTTDHGPRPLGGEGGERSEPGEGPAGYLRTRGTCALLTMDYIDSVEELEDRLASPSARDEEAMRRLSGDIVILGAGGKMGPSLARRVRRAFEAAGVKRRVIAVSRFSNSEVVDEL